MKIKYNKFIENCTDINHKWQSSYSTEFFNKYFDTVNYIEGGIEFSSFFINSYNDKQNEFEQTRYAEHKSSIIIYFTLYEDGNFNIKSRISPWSIRCKKISIEQIDDLLKIYSIYIKELYKDIYNKKLFNDEEEN